MPCGVGPAPSQAEATPATPGARGLSGRPDGRNGCPSGASASNSPSAGGCPTRRAEARSSDRTSSASVRTSATSAAVGCRVSGAGVGGDWTVTGLLVAVAQQVQADAAVAASHRTLSRAVIRSDQVDEGRHDEDGNEHKRGPSDVPEEGRHLVAVLLGDGADHEVRAVPDV